MNLPGAFPIVDTHPDETATTDLRLLTPWDELSIFAEDMTKDIETLDSHEHGHLPFVVILLHYLNVWKAGHDGSYPTSYGDKVAFRKVISEAMRTNTPEGGEENFEEAIAAVVKTVVKPSLPSSVKEVFEYKHAEPVRRAQASLYYATSKWYADIHSRLKSSPVSGSLPTQSRSSTSNISVCLFQAAYPI
jgi:NEDD8-activating enzyme E1 regulatory subunit